MQQALVLIALLSLVTPASSYRFLHSNSAIHSSSTPLVFPCPTPPSVPGHNAFPLEEAWALHTEYQKSWYWIVGPLCVIKSIADFEIDGSLGLRNCENPIGFEIAEAILNTSTSLIAQLHFEISGPTHYAEVFTGVPEVFSSETGSTFDLAFNSATASATFTLEFGTPGEVGSVYRLKASAPNATIDLILENQNPTMYHGNGGYMHISEAPASVCTGNYYVSMGSLLTIGSISLNGRTFLVGGTSWMDNQWTGPGSSFMKGWITSFFHIGNSDVMLYLLFLDGLKLLYNSSVVEIQTSNGLRTSGKITGFDLLNKWTSSNTNISYPVGLTVSTNVPALSQAHLYVDPSKLYFLDQEIVYGKNKISSYWEGDVLTQQLSSLETDFKKSSSKNRGYLELQGFLGESFNITITQPPIRSADSPTSSASFLMFSDVHSFTILGCLLLLFLLKPKY